MMRGEWLGRESLYGRKLSNYLGTDLVDILDRQKREREKKKKRVEAMQGSPLECCLCRWRGF